MNRFLKKIFNKFTIAFSIAIVCICSLFSITKTYAYDYNDNTNQLVGNDLLQNATFEIKTNNGTSYQDLTYNNISLNIDSNNDINITLNSGTVSIYEGQNLATYLYLYTNINPILNQSNNMLYTQFVVLIENSATYSHTFNLQIIPYLYAPLENNKYLSSNNGYGDTSLSLQNYGISSTIGSMFTGASYRRQIGGSTSNYTYCFGLNLPTIVNNNSFGSGTIKLKILAFNNNYNIDYAFNNNQNFVPYSSVEQLQQDYNALQSQYNELRIVYQQYQDTHSYSNTQYNDLVSQISSLQNQLSQLQLQYDTYVATHSYTDTEYNELNTQYQTLQTNYTTLQNNYDLLQQQYNQLLNDFNSLRKSSTIGWWSYIDNVEIYYSTYDYTFTFDELFNGDYFGDFSFYISRLVNTLDFGTSNECYVDITFKERSVLLKDFTLSYYDDELFANDVYYGLKDYLNNLTYSVPTSSDFINERILTGIANGVVYTDEEWNAIINDGRNDSYRYNLYLTNFLLEIRISDSYDLVATVNNTVDMTSFQSGYTSGYTTAYNESIDLRNANIDLRNDIADVRRENIALATAYDSLQTSYNNLVNGNNFTSLFFTIAETPFSSFKQIWNVDFLGVNLSGFVTGLLFIGLMIWLVKKIF